MNRINPTRAIAVALRLGFLVLMALALILTQVQASNGSPAAMLSVDTIRISKIDTSLFPEVSVQALFRDSNFNVTPIADLAGLEVFEEGVLVDAMEPKEIQVGIDVVFVLDVGLGVKAAGNSGIPRYHEMRDVVQAYLNRMDSNDQAAIVSVEGSAVTISQPLTSDTQELKSTLSNLIKEIENRSIDSPSSGLTGVSSGLDQLQKSSKVDEHIQTVVLLTAGEQTVSDPELTSVTTKAQNNGVKIHTVITNFTSVDATLQRAIAVSESAAVHTGGIAVNYRGISHVDPILNWIEAQRSAVVINFRSSLGSNQARSVQLRMKGGALATSSYKVDLMEPKVVVVSPENNIEITRKAPEATTDMDTIDPKDLSIDVRVEWVDGKPRKITEATLYVNDKQIGLPQPYPGDSFSFIYSLQEFRDKGSQTLSIRIRTIDELNLEGKSDLITTKVTVIKPDMPPSLPPAQACTGMEGFRKFICETTPVINSVSGVIAMAVAIIALVLVVVFRRQTGGAVKGAIDFARETIIRLTRPSSTEVGATLKVQKGDPSDIGKVIPLYINTVTPIGRDRRQAEIIFDESSETSVVSRKHCEIREYSEAHGSQFAIRDLGSSHGTFLNGVRLDDGAEKTLTNQDVIEIGPVLRGGIQLLFETAVYNGYDQSDDSMPAYPQPPDDLDVDMNTVPYHLSEDDETNTITQAER